MSGNIYNAEVAVVGSCLVDRTSLIHAVDRLKPGYFSDPKLAVIFQIMSRLLLEHVAVDVVTLSESMNVNERAAVPVSLLVDIADKVPTALHHQHYAKIVRDSYFGRKLTVALKESAENPLDEKLRDAVYNLWIEHRAGNRNETKSLKNDLPEYVDILERRSRGIVAAFPTGFPKLDFMTGGFRPGQLIVVGADTSRGKTTFALNLAHRLIMNGRRSMFFSAEMGFEELIDRILSSRLKIPLPKIRSHIKKVDVVKILGELEHLQKKDLTVVDQGRLAIETIRTHVEAHHPEVLFVDYLQQFRPPQDANRAAFYSWVSDELKALAREKNLVIVATSQFRRAEGRSKDREPTLADFKESGGIENAADIALLLHAKKDEEIGPTTRYDFILAKQRNGPTGRIKFVFLKDTVTFEEEEVE